MIICIALASVILIYNGWLVARGVNGWIHAANLLGTISRERPGSVKLAEPSDPYGGTRCVSGTPGEFFKDAACRVRFEETYKYAMWAW
jgi:hypothetical protein